MQCPKCHTNQVGDDAYCSNCGADLTVPSTSIVPIQSRLPMLLQNSVVTRNVAAGVGALAIGVGFELLRRNFLPRLASNRSIERSLPAARGMKDILFPHPDKPRKLQKGYEIHETIISVQRVIRRV